MLTKSRKVLLILCLTTIFTVATTYATPAPATEFADVMIGFHETIQPQVLAQAGAEVKIQFQYMPVVAARIPTTALAGLIRNPAVKFIEPDATVTISSRRAQTVPWGVDRIDAVDVHQEKGITGTGVKVAVLDTGIDPDHRDLNVITGVSFVEGNPNWSDDNGHGTHVAGIIAALDNGVDVIGVAPGVDLYSVKVLGSNGYGSSSWLAAGIEWCITNNINVINISVADSIYSEALETACENAWNAGIIIVAAAGNSGYPSGAGDNVKYPARYPTVIAVASTTSSDVRSSWSSTGPAIEISAPGSDIISTNSGGGLTTMSGTSMAAPHVAGVAALIIRAKPQWSAYQVRERIKTTAQPIGDQDPDKYGHGLVNAYAAIPDVPHPSMTQVAVSTDKTLYEIGETISINVHVQDGLDYPLSDANVNVSISVPSGKAIILTGVTNSGGDAAFTLQATQSYGQGQYAISATVSKAGYNTVTATTSCSVVQSLALDVTVWTDKELYQPYEFATMWALVKDPSGNPVHGASVHFHVLTPSGTVESTTTYTHSDGLALWWVFVTPETGYGAYYVTAAANSVGYHQGTGSTVFFVY